MKKITTILLIALASINAQAQTPGNSLHFDGANDYATAALPTVLGTASSANFTIEAWIKPTSSAFERVVFAQLNTSNFVSLSLSTSNEVYFYINNTTGMKSTNTLPTGTWSHVACTWDFTTTTMEIYINGVLETLISGGSSSTASDNSMAIGAKTDGAQPFGGELDEVRIWDVKRSSCQILAGMTSEYTVTQPNLVAYYNFNQGTAGGANTGVTSLPDFTTNFDGTLQNFALTGASSNWLASAAGITALNAPAGSSASGTDTQSACGSFLWIDGNTYTASNTSATHTIAGGASNGCDSTVTLDLTITPVNIATTLAGTTLSATATGVSYQWLDCNNGNAVISGATNQTYTATTNGNYSVEITDGSCVDTSACVAVSTVGAGLESEKLKDVKVYPNPTIGKIWVDLGVQKDVRIRLLSITGQVMSEKFNSSGLVEIDLIGAAGIYFVELISDGQERRIKLVKE